MRLTSIRTLRISKSDVEKFMTQGGELVVHLRRGGVIVTVEDDRPAPSVPAPVAYSVRDQTESRTMAPRRDDGPTRNERSAPRDVEKTTIQPMALGNQLRIWRENNGYTQTHIAQHLGVSQPYICQVEKGTIRASVSVAHKLNFLLGNISKL